MIAMAKVAFKKKKNLFTSKLDLNFMKKLVKCIVWSMALYGAENWTLRATDQKRLESFEMWCWRRMEKISWTDHVRNEEVLLTDIKYLGSMLTDDGRCTCEIKSRIAMAKAEFNKKKNLFTSKLDLNLRKKLVKCYVWSMALYGA